LEYQIKIPGRHSLYCPPQKSIRRGCAFWRICTDVRLFAHIMFLLDVYEKFEQSSRDAR